MAVKFSNNAATVLAANASSSTTSLTVSDGSVFPTLSGSDYTYVTLEDLSSNREVVKVTGISGNTLTVVRGQDGTSARAFSAGVKCELRITAALLNDLNTEADTESVSIDGDTMTGGLTVPSLSVTGNTTTSGTFDGRDVAADGTKLDGIEASADVTDTTNVTAAGALMDSEVTNLAQVKAFDSADYATAAQGTTADNALPKTGGAMTGAITTNSTFDGRDVAADGTKLDGIQSGANNYALPSGYATETYVNTQVTNLVDSSPATLNTLNELAAALGDDPSFASTVSTSIGTKLPKSGGTMTGAITFASGQEFDGRDVSADGTKLDGIAASANNYSHPSAHSINFITGLQTALNGKVDDSQVLTNVPSGAVFTDTTYSVQDGQLSQNSFTNADHTKLNAIETGATADQTNAEIRAAVEAATDSNVFTDADHSKLNGIAAGATANAGDITGVTAGSGLTGGGSSGSVTLNVIGGDGITANADNIVVDSTVGRNTANYLFTQRIRFGANEQNNWDTIATTTSSQGSLEVFNSGVGNDAFMSFHAGNDYAGYFGLDADTNDIAWGGWSVGAVKHRIWHAGNDGSTSGLDADLLDGQHGSYYRAYGNLTGTPTIPSVGNGTLTINTSGSASGGGTFTANQSGNTTITINGTGITSYTETDTLASVTGRGASTSTALTFNGDTVHSQIRFTGNGGNSGVANDSYAIYQEAGAWSHPYPDLIIAYHTGIKIGGHSNYGGTRFYNNNPTSGSIIASIGNGDNHLRGYHDGFLRHGGSTDNKIWTAGNDGSGSGLDADLLDGQHASYFAPLSSIPTQLPANGGNADTVDGLHAASFIRSDAADSFTGTLAMATQKALVANDYGHGVYGVYSASRHQHVWSMGTSYNLASNGASVGNLYGISYTHTNVGTGYGNNSAAGLGHQLNGRANGSLQWALGDGIWSSNTGSVWGASNDGSGSGLDADLLDGRDTSTSGDANTIVLRTSSGHIYGQYIFSTYFNAASGNSENPSIGQVWTQSTSDNYLRKSTPAHFKSQLGLWHTGNDGSGSGLDADTVDGVHANKFWRLDASNNVQANSVIDSNYFINFGPNTSNSGQLRVGGNGHTVSGTYHASVATTNGNLHLDAGSNKATYINNYNGSGGIFFGNGAGTTVARMYSDGQLYKSSGTSNPYWNSANDGSGSGLDADTLDGLNLSASTTNNGANLVMRTDSNGYANFGWIYTASGTASGSLSRIYCSQDGYLRYLSPANLGTSWLRENVYNNLIDSTGSGANLNTVFNNNRSGNIDCWSGSNFPSGTSHVQGIQVRHQTGSHYGFQLVNQYDQQQMFHRQISNNSFGSWNKIWSSSTDGSGSGLDADTLDGSHASSFITTSATQSNQIYIRGTGPTLYLRDTDHKVSMLHTNGNTFYVLCGATDSTTWSLVNGRWPMELNLSSLNVTFGGSVTANSDRSLKENIKPIGNSMEMFEQIDAKRFDWIDGHNPDGDLGFIAQDVQAAGLTEVVFEKENKQPGTGELLSTKLTLDYSRMVAVLWDVVKQQQVQIDELKTQLENM
jgi:hypothetical protein